MVKSYIINLHIVTVLMDLQIRKDKIMKLFLGENIRRLRREKEWTQDELADRLGTTSQSVSRWEMGSTYPDMELLPVLASIFSVTVDELMGIPETEKKKRAHECFDRLRRLCLDRKSDPEVICDTIREIRRDFICDDEMWRFWGEGNDRKYRTPAILPEVRKTAEAYLEANRNSNNSWLCIEMMAETEDDEHLDEFLKRYASEYDLSVDNLKYQRYFRREEWEKFDIYRARRMFGCLDELLDRRRLLRDDGGILRAESLYQASLFREKLLDAVSVGEEAAAVDAWTFIRIQVKFDKAAALSSLDRQNEALEELEQGVDLLERVMKITEKVRIKSSSRWLKPLEWYAEESFDNINNNPDGEMHRNIFVSECSCGNVCCYCIYPQQFADALTTGRWSDVTPLFDPVRNDARFLDCVKRVEKLCVSKSAD